MFIFIVIIMGGSIIHPNWDRSGWRMTYLSKFIVGGFYGESIIVVSEFKYFVLWGLGWV